jgi:hypothetical protein
LPPATSTSNFWALQRTALMSSDWRRRRRFDAYGLT